MICPKCKSDGVLVKLMSVEYYYCRTCKDEIKLETVEPEQGSEDLVAEFERLVAEGGKDVDIDYDNPYYPYHGGYPGDWEYDDSGEEDIQ